MLRKDIPLMGDKEVNGWVESLIKYTNRIDLQILAQRLKEEFDKENTELIFSRIHHMCDRCERVYPEHITWCSNCNNDKLRSFSVYDNIKELERNYKN